MLAQIQGWLLDRVLQELDQFRHYDSSSEQWQRVAATSHDKSTGLCSCPHHHPS